MVGASPDERASAVPTCRGTNGRAGVQQRQRTPNAESRNRYRGVKSVLGPSLRTNAAMRLAVLKRSSI